MLRFLQFSTIGIVLLIFSGCSSSMRTQVIGGSTVITYDKVWYRYLDYRTGNFAWQDKGALVLNDESIEFFGEKYQITIKDIVDISFDKLEKTLSTDPSKWVKIKYNDEEGNVRKALFMESGSLGWDGYFGGNQKMYEIILQKYAK